jgi:hypothetical protein
VISKLIKGCLAQVVPDSVYRRLKIRDQKQLMCQSVSKNDILLPQSKDPGVEEIFMITIHNSAHTFLSNFNCSIYIMWFVIAIVFHVSSQNTTIYNKKGLHGSHYL